MRPPHRILNRNQVHRLAAEHLQAHLKFKDYKRKTSAQVLWSLLLAAAARITSLSDACQRLRDAPSDETVRKALLATLPDYAVLQRQLNAALAGHLPRTLRTHLQRLAIDLTLIPYHGQPFRDLNEIDRGQAKDGTSHFHAYATAYIIRKGQRYTVALTGVTKGEALKDVVQRLLRQAASVGVRTRLLLLDRGFYSVAVVRYLQAARVPFLMPVVCHGRSPKHPNGPSGSYVFRTGKKSGWSAHTLSDTKKRTATVSIGVKCRNYRGQWKRHGRQVLIYAYGAISRRPRTRCSRPTGCGSGSRRAIGSCTRGGSGRPVAVRRCGCCTWGSRWCSGTSGCGCITRSWPCHVEEGGSSSWSGCGGRHCCCGCSMWRRRRSGSTTRPSPRGLCRMSLRWSLTGQ